MRRPTPFIDLYQATLRKQISPTRIVAKIKEHLDAKKTVSAVSGKDAGSGTVDFIEVDDYAVQQKAIEQWLKSNNIGNKQEHEHSGNVSVSLEVVDYSSAVKK